MRRISKPEMKSKPSNSMGSCDENQIKRAITGDVKEDGISSAGSREFKDRRENRRISQSPVNIASDWDNFRDE